MKNSYSFTLVIGYRHRIDRFLNLKKMIDWALGFGGIEIILVEQDSEEKLKPYNLRGVRKIFTKSNLPFNRSWAFNVGLKWSSTNAIVFSDADVIMDPTQFIESLKKLEEYDCVNPSKNIIYLSQQESNMGLDQWRLIFRDNELNNSSFCRGMVMFRKDSIESIGGWCEDFIGWGAEDDYQTFKVNQLLNNFEFDFKCYHLYHNVESKNDFYYQRNIQLLEKLKSMTIDETKRFINNSMPKIGKKMTFSDK